MGYEEIRSLRFINFLNLGVVDMNWDSLKKSIEDPNAQDSESSLADEMKMLKEIVEGIISKETDHDFLKYTNELMELINFAIEKDTILGFLF